MVYGLLMNAATWGRWLSSVRGWLPHHGTKCDLRIAGDEPCEASSKGEKATCIATTLM